MYSDKACGQTITGFIFLEEDMKKQMKKTVDIYFGDLTKKAQKNILEYLDISSAKELNWDVYPIATIQIEVLEEE